MVTLYLSWYRLFLTNSISVRYSPADLTCSTKSKHTIIQIRLTLFSFFIIIESVHLEPVIVYHVQHGSCEIANSIFVVLHLRVNGHHCCYLGRRLTQATGEEEATVRILQRMSVTVQRGNAASVMGSLGSAPHLMLAR